VIVNNGRGKPKSIQVGFEAGKSYVDPLTDTLKIKWDKTQELGWQIIEVDGKRSKYYHFVFRDKKTGKEYMPYEEVCGKDGKMERVYLDFRNMLYNPDFMRGKVLEIFFVYDHRDMDNSIKTRYDGVHFEFKLDEFTGEHLNLSELARVMRKHYLGDIKEDYRFLFLQLRAKALADAAREPLVPSPVFSFDGFAFSFSLPAGLAREEAPAVVPERMFGAHEPAMALESRWFGAAIEECVAQESVPALLAQMPVLAESLAVAEFPVMVKMKEQGFEAKKTPSKQAESSTVRLAAGAAAPEISLAVKRAGERAKSHVNSSKKEENRNRPGFDEETSGVSGRRAKKKAHTKPVPFSALKNFKAVIFDLDGVIVDSEMVHPRTFERALSKYGIKIENAHWKRAYTGIGSYAIFDDIVKKYGIKEDARELVKKRNEIYMEEIQRNKLPVIAGFAEVHQLLLENAVLEAVASGGHINHVEESMRSAGIGKLPFIAIEHVRKGKPAPEIFLKAAKRLRVKPSECIVFEDSLSGVEAAARAGMPCVALSTTMSRKELLGKAALVVNDYRSKKLKKLLAMLLEKRDSGAKKRGKTARNGKGRQRKLGRKGR